MAIHGAYHGSLYQAILDKHHDDAWIEMGLVEMGLVDRVYGCCARTSWRYMGRTLGQQTDFTSHSVGFHIEVGWQSLS